MNMFHIENKLNNIIKQNESEELNLLLSRKEISPDFEFENGYTLLSKVLYGKNIDMLNVLIKHNVDINKTYRTKNNSKDNDYSPVYIPILSDDVVTFDILFRNGLDKKMIVKDGDYENDMFMSIITKNQKNLMKYLIENKVRYECPYVYSRKLINVKTNPDIILLREIRNQETSILAINNGYADNLPFMDIVKLTKMFISKKNYKNIEALFSKVLNKFTDDEKSFFVKQIMDEGSYTDTGNTYKKTLDLLSLHIKNENFNSFEITNYISKVNFPAIDLLLKHNKLNKENCFHKGNSVFYKVMTIPLGGQIYEENKQLFKEKMSFALLNSVVDYKSDPKIYEYVKTSFPEYVAIKEKEELSKIFNNSEDKTKPNINNKRL